MVHLRGNPVWYDKMHSEMSHPLSNLTLRLTGVSPYTSSTLYSEQLKKKRVSVKDCL